MNKSIQKISKKINDSAGIVSLSIWILLSVIIGILGSVIENSNYIG